MLPSYRCLNITDRKTLDGTKEVTRGNQENQQISTGKCLSGYLKIYFNFIDSIYLFLLVKESRSKNQKCC